MLETGEACSADDARLVAFELPCSLAEVSEVGEEVKKEDVLHSEDPLLENRASDDAGLKAFRPCSDSCSILNRRPINPKPNFMYLFVYSNPHFQSMSHFINPGGHLPATT